MIVRKFKIAEWEDTGIIGLKPLWYPDYVVDATEAPAHDVLEHFPTYQGGWHDEWMALGAMIFVRGPYSTEYYSVGENLASEIVYLQPKYECEEYHIGSFAPPIDKTYVLDTDVAEQIRNVWKFYRKHIRAEEIKPLPRQDIRYIQRWIAYGYQRAVRRYRGRSPGNWGYENINKAVPKFLFSEEYLGMPVTLRCEADGSNPNFYYDEDRAG